MVVGEGGGVGKASQLQEGREGTVGRVMCMYVCVCVCGMCVVCGICVCVWYMCVLEGVGWDGMHVYCR